MLLLLASLAVADETTLVYDVFLGGRDIGDRTVTVRYLARPSGERRVLEVVTSAETPLGSVRCRQSGQSGPRGATFTTNLDVGGVLSEVQGIEMPGGGWQLVRADAEGVHESTLTAGQAHLTSLDLFDPGRTRRLLDAGTVGVLLSETGTILTGELAAGQATTVKIAGKTVAGTRYSLASTDGAAEFVVDNDGVLLSSEVATFGGVLRTVARTLPASRSFGTIDVVDSPGAGVQEENL
jgi:hypothetical protein